MMTTFRLPDTARVGNTVILILFVMLSRQAKHLKSNKQDSSPATQVQNDESISGNMKIKSVAFLQQKHRFLSV